MVRIASPSTVLRRATRPALLALLSGVLLAACGDPQAAPGAGGAQDAAQVDPTSPPSLADASALAVETVRPRRSDMLARQDDVSGRPRDAITADEETLARIDSERTSASGTTSAWGRTNTS